MFRRRGVGFVTVSGIVQYTVEREIAKVTGNGRDRRILESRFHRGKRGRQRIDLVARELAVKNLTPQRQSVPHRGSGARRLDVEQSRPGADIARCEADDDEAIGHEPSRLSLGICGFRWSVTSASAPAFAADSYAAATRSTVAS